MTLDQPQPLCATSSTSICEHVAGLRAVDRDRPGERVDAGAVDLLRCRRPSSPGCTCAPLASTALEVDGVAGGDRQARREVAIPARVRGRGAERVCSLTAISHRHLQLDQRVARQAADADGRADVAAGLAEDLEEEVGGAVDDLGRVGEAG